MTETKFSLHEVLHQAPFVARIFLKKLRMKLLEPLQIMIDAHEVCILVSSKFGPQKIDFDPKPSENRHVR